MVLVAGPFSLLVFSSFLFTAWLSFFLLSIWFWFTSFDTDVKDLMRTHCSCTIYDLIFFFSWHIDFFGWIYG